MKDFTAKSSLIKHISVIHESKKDFKCKLRKEITQEIGIIVENEKNIEHRCSICKKTFSSIYNLENHKTYAHEKVKDMKCTICEKTFSVKGHLKKHILTTLEKN